MQTKDTKFEETAIIIRHTSFTNDFAASGVSSLIPT